MRFVSPSKKTVYFILFVSVALGIFLRLVWLGDMEWKRDEMWMFNASQKIVRTGDWPSVGFPSSAGGIPHPGMHIWIFGVIAFFAHNPESMTRIVQITNILALLGFCLLAVLRIEEDQKELWLWGLALAAVSPLAVLFSRKLWANDVLPLFSFLVIFSHTYRRTVYGALLWGFFGILIGQIHMAGFPYALALILFTFIYEHANQDRHKTRWGYWFLGTAIGSIGLVPWVVNLWTSSYPSLFKFLHLIANVILFPLYWFAHALGIGLIYSMHSAFWNFLKEPYLNGTPTFLVGILHLFLCATGLFSLKLMSKKIRPAILEIKSGTFLSNLTQLDFYLYSFFFVMGFLTVIGGKVIYVHHLIIVFPFTCLWLVRTLFPRKKLIFSVLVSQLFITVLFLSYVHKHNGVREGDYGVSYKAQMHQEQILK
jgi:hypothetical protein